MSWNTRIIAQVGKFSWEDDTRIDMLCANLGPGVGPREDTEQCGVVGGPPRVDCPRPNSSLCAETEDRSHLGLLLYGAIRLVRWHNKPLTVLFVDLSL